MLSAGSFAPKIKMLNASNWWHDNYFMVPILELRKNLWTSTALQLSKKQPLVLTQEQAADTVCHSQGGFSALHVHSSIHAGCKRNLSPLYPSPVTLRSSSHKPAAELAAQVPVPHHAKTSQHQLRIPNNSAEQAQKGSATGPRSLHAASGSQASCIAWIHSGCLISTSQISDIYLRLESLK